MKKYLFIIIPILFSIISLKSYADTKDMTVGLTSEYTQATFYFEFEEEKTYNVTVTYPSGLTHETTIEGTEGSVAISDIEDGEYKLSISAEGDIRVKSRVEAKRTEVSANTKDINVSTVVSGLKIYFKDTDLCLEWDENTNEENINVEVTEPTTMQILDSSKLSGHFYTLDFDESFKQLEIYLVPAKSSGVEGAGSRFTVDVVLDNKGRVTFPEKTLYNVSEYSFNASVLDNMSIIVEEDGKVVYDEIKSTAGDYEITIPLNDMKNHITVWLKDENGNLNSFKTVIDRDIDAPIFSINQFDTVTKDSKINISGSVSETKAIMINDYEVFTDEYGRFTFDNMLVIGDNKITLSATDEAGNTTEIEYIVTRKKVNYTPVLIVALIGFITMIVGVVLKKKKEFASESKPLKNKPIKQAKKAEKSKPIKEKTITKKAFSINSVLDFLPIVTLTVILFITATTLIKNTVVASGSMEPTLKTGSVCIYNRLAYKHKSVSRGDIICFYSTEKNEVMSKRVIGIAGDEITFKDGFVFINGLKAEESYIPEDMETNSTKTFVVPDSSVFVLGDNREESYDSRYWENPYISLSQIYGKYLGTIG